MPFKSDAQRKLMYAVANNPAVAKKTGISKKVADKFIQHKAEGGVMATKKFRGDEGSAEYKAKERKHVKAMEKAGVPKNIIAEEKKEAGMKKGGKVGYADGGMMMRRPMAAAPAASAPRVRRPLPDEAVVSPEKARLMQRMMDEERMRKSNEEAYNRASKIAPRPAPGASAGMKKGGKVGCGSMKKYAKGGGIEVKGKTRGKVC